MLPRRLLDIAKVNNLQLTSINSLPYTNIPATKNQSYTFYIRSVERSSWGLFSIMRTSYSRCDQVRFRVLEKTLSETIEIDPGDPSPARYDNYYLAVEKTHPSPFPSNLVQNLLCDNSWLIITIIFLSFVPSAKADDGDEFTNNLFSDLAPILTLFGEQVTKQFLSESSGIADCILFCMAPLGVITAIVSVIRVAGQPWLKAIVGRGKEGRAQAEIELMSSNSQDVGEMWNGQAIIRVLGTPSIFQFVYDPDRAKTDPIKYISTLSDQNPFFERDTETRVAHPLSMNIRRRWDVDLDLEIPLLESSNDAVREYDEISPPNISLNARGVAISDYEKWLLAIFGTIIQLSVLIYEGLISYRPSWRSKFLKNGSEPSPYAFPCTAFGTLSLNISMFACCYIIDCASAEEDWSRVEHAYEQRAIESRHRCRLAWIQKGGTVNDQSFKPYTIFGHDGKETVTTSRRCSEALLFRLRYWVAIFTFATVAGFVVQFVGLRGMHWSATIAQLVATGILTFLRYFVRRHMLREPTALPATEDYELDSMARRIGDCDIWRIVSDTPVDHKPDYEVGNNILQIRKRLGELSQWPTSSQEVAISLCTAIEQTMNIIYQSEDIRLKTRALSKTELHWSMKVLTVLGGGDHSKTYGQLKFKISRVTSWKPWELSEDMKSDIAGALSLWMLYVSECDRLYRGLSSPASFQEEARVDIGACARVLVWPDIIDRDLFTLWRGLDEADIYFERPNRIRSQTRPPKHRFTGEQISDLGQTNPATVVITKGTSMEKHLALQIFSDFLAKAVPLIDSISGETKIQKDDKSGKKEIRNTALTRLVEAVSDTGLGMKGEVLLVILSHLGKHDKLPELEIGIGEAELSPADAERRRRNYRVTNKWHKVASNIHNLVNGHDWQSSLNTEQLEIWSSWQIAARFCKRTLALAHPEGRSRDSHHPQRVFLSWLEAVNLDDLPPIPKVPHPQKITGAFLEVINDLKQKSLDGKMQRLLVPFSPAHTISIDNYEISLLKESMKDNITREESMDILRIAAKNGYDSVLEALIDSKINVMRIDNITESPLFIAASSGHISVAQLILEQLRFYIPEDYRLFHAGYYPLPIIIAAINGHEAMVRLLLTHSPASSYTNHQNHALVLAARNGHITLVGKLLSGNYNIHIDAILGVNAERALRVALGQPNIGVDLSNVLHIGTALQAAARGGHLHIVRQLMKSGANANLMQAPGGHTALGIAVLEGNIDIMDELLSAEWASRVDTSAASRHGRTALQAASANGNLEVVNKLLEAGADINAGLSSTDGRTPLQAAAGGGHLAVVTLLLNKGACISASKLARNNWRRTLQAAACGGHLDIVEFLLSKIPSIVDGTPAEKEEDGRIALQAAAEGGHFSVVKRLLQGGVPVNGRSMAATIALQAAGKGGHMGILDALMDAAANVGEGRLKSEGGKALQAAAGGGHIELVQRLLEKRVNVNMKPNPQGGRTALQAAAEGGHLTVVDLLLNAGALVNLEPALSHGRTALQAAAEGGHLDVVNRLLDTGAAVNASPAERYGLTALQAAAGGGFLSVMRSLLDRGADVNGGLSDFRGRTALQAAIEGGHMDVVDLLLGRGAALNSEPSEKNGRTALQAAAEGGHLNVVKRLVDSGADVNESPGYGEGRTALQAAAECGHLGVVDVLLGYGSQVVNAKVATVGGRTAVEAAAENGHTEVLIQLLRNRIDAVPESESDGLGYALEYAAKCGHLVPVAILLEDGADPNKRGRTGRTALQTAAEGGHIDVVNVLLAEGADINTLHSYNGRTPLQAAAEGGHIDVVNALLAKNADVNAPPADSGGQTALQAAAKGGHIDVVNALLAKGADVNAPPADSGGQTALQAAAEGGHIDVVNALLAKDADVNAHSGGQTALDAAAKEGHIDVVNALLAKGADVDVPRKYYRGTALQAAAKEGHISVVNALLAKGADIHAPPLYHYGRTTLQAAAEGGHIDVVNALLAKGAYVNAPPADSGGQTALQAAAKGGHIDVVNALLAKGADVNASPARNDTQTALQGAAEEGRTALQAAAEGGHVDVVNALLAKNANVNACPAGDHGQTALQAAAKEGHIDIVNALLAKGADVNARPEYYRGTALQAAAKEGHISVVNALLANGADINAPPSYYHGRTALQAAAEGGHIDIANALLAEGAYVNARPASSHGRTALQAAAEGGHIDIVKLLLAKGADVNASSAGDDGLTALQAAAEGDHIDIVNILQNDQYIVRLLKHSYWAVVRPVWHCLILIKSLRNSTT